MAHFVATVPDGGISTTRNNEWVIKLVVDWSDRFEISRILDSMPMQLKVSMRRLAE